MNKKRSARRLRPARLQWLLPCAMWLAALPAWAQTAVPAESAAQQKAQLEATNKKLIQMEQEQARLLKAMKAGKPSGDPRLDQIEAEIAARIEQENRRPKRGYVNPGTRDVALQIYLKKFSDKIECTGNKSYPEAARGGTFRIVATVSVLASGKVEKIEIDKSSGSKEVDASVRRIVRAAAPFEKFAPEIGNRFQVLDLTSTWNFDRSNDREPAKC